MKKYIKIALLLSLLMGIFSLALADTVTIGGGTGTTSYLPIYGLYHYNYTQQIYTQAQISTAGDITKIRFYYVSGAIANSKDWIIYMGHTTKTEFEDNTDWVPLADLTQVFAGDVSSFLPNANNWMEITLNTPFSYNNNDNLLIAIDENTSGFSSMSWGSFTSGTNTGIYYYNDTNNPDPASPPAANNMTSAINRIQLIFPASSAPNAPVLVSPANNAIHVNNPVLSWNSAATGGDATAYDLYFGTTANPPLVASDLTLRSFTIENWNYSSTYYWKVVAKNAIGSSPDSDIWSFTTREDPIIYTLPYLEGFEAGNTHNTAIQGWDQLAVSGSDSWTANTSFADYGRTPRTGSWNAFLRYSNTRWMFKPVQLQADIAYRVSLYARQDGATASNATIRISYGASATAAGMTNTILAPTGVVNGNYQRLEGSFIPEANGIYYIGILGTINGSPWYISIDDITIEEMPASPVFGVNPTSWDFPNTLINTEVVKEFTIRNSGAGTMNITDIAIADSYFSIVDSPVPAALGMNESATFGVKYRPTAAGNHSGTVNIVHDGISSTVELTGVCYDPTIYSFPWTEDFSGTSFPPANWARLTGLYPTDTPTSTTGGWASANFANISDPANKSARLNIYGTTSKYWLATPPISIPATGYELNFDLALTTYSGSNPVDPAQQQDDRFIVLISDSSTMTNASVLREWNNSGSEYVYNGIATLGQNVSIDLSAYAGTKYIAFYGESTLTGGDNNVYVDNVTVREIPEEPIFSYTPSSLDFGALMHGASSAPRNVVVSNIGGSSFELNANMLSLIGANADEFSFSTANLPAVLSAGQSVNIPVSVTATTEGAISATLSIAYNGNSYDVALSANGLPAGLQIIGNGLTVTRYPLGSYFGYERSASLYTAAEIGAGNKRINTLGWYATQSSSDAVPTKIYLKSYAPSTLSAGTWPSFIEGATLVYDDTDSAIAANDWKTYTLQNTFDLDSGNNLLVLVERNFGGGGGSAGSSAPAIRATTLSAMHHTITVDTNPPTTNTSISQASRPNLMFVATSYELTDPPNPALVVSPADAAEYVALNASLNWASGGGAPTGYKLYFGLTNPPAFVADLGDVSTYDAGTLAYNSTYYWQVVPYNAIGDAINCPVWSFTTRPNPTISSFPFFEGFEAAYTHNQAVGVNWEQLIGPSFTSKYWMANNTETTYNRTPKTGDWNATLQYSGQSALVRPIALEADTQYRLEFYARQDGATASNAWMKASLGSEATLAALNQSIITETNLVNGDYQMLQGYFSVATSGIYYLAIQGYINNTPWYISLDDISITALQNSVPAAPLLASPADASLNMPKAGFNLSWTADLENGGMPTYYQVFLARDTDTIYDEFSTETNNSFANTAAFEELSFAYGERWYWTVQAFNGLGDALAEDIFWFEIEADPAVVSFPWLENFDAAAALPNGWTVVDVDGAGTNWTSTTAQAHSAPNSFLHNYSSNANQEAWLITPPITLPETTEGTIMLNWWNYSVWPSYMESNTLKLGSSNNPAATDWVDIWIQDDPVTAWTMAAANLNAYLGQTVYLAFVYEGYDANGWYIDDVKIAEIFSDDTPPSISHNPHLNTPITDAPYTIVAQVVDDATWNSDIAFVRLYWSIDDGETWSAPVNMSFADGNYTGQIPPQELYSFVVYFIEAADSEMNITESQVYGFNVTNPLWLAYDTGNGGYMGYSQTFGPAVIYDNPFYGSGSSMQLLATDGSTYWDDNATLVIYELQGSSWSPVYSQTVSFSQQGYDYFDLEDENIIIQSAQFMVAYQGIPSDNGFLFDDTYNYGTSRVIINGSLYMVAEPGQWAIGAQVTDAEITTLDSPVLTIALNTAGNPQLSWNAIDGATGYIVEYSADPYGASWLAYPETALTTMEISNPETARFFRVIASNAADMRISSQTISISGESISATKSLKAPKTEKAKLLRK